MDWNVGIGIGLQGRPPMFEGVARAREQAAQQYQARKQAQKASKLDKMEQNFLKSIQGKDYLPVDKNRVDSLIAEFNDALDQQVDSDSPDYSAIAEITQRATGEIFRADKRKKNASMVLQRPADDGLSLDDAQTLMTIDDPDVLTETLSLRGSGGLGYDKQTGEFFVNPIKNFVGTQEFAAKFVKDGGDRLFTDSMPDEEFKINNRTFRGRAINPQMRDAFIDSRLSGENLEMVRREMNMSVYYGKPKPERGSEEEMAAMVDYVGNVYDQNIAPLRVRDAATPSKGMTLNIYPEQKQGVGDGFTGQMRLNLYDSKGQELGTELSTTSIEGFMIPNEVIKGISIPTTAFDASTGERITKTGGTITSSKIDVVPVYTGKPIEIDVPKTKEAGGGVLKIKLQPGMVVPDELIYNFADILDSKFEFKKVAFATFLPTGASERGAVNIYYPATYLEESTMQEKNPKKARQINDKLVKLNDFVRKNRRFTPAQIEQFKKTLEEGGAVLDVKGATKSTGPGGNLKNSTSEDRMKALEKM